MKSTYIIAVFISISLISCKKQVADVQKVKHDDMAASTEEISVEVANEKDPICEMSVKGMVNHTANYKGKTYGFCSSVCKGEFKKNPEKFAIK